MSGGPRPCIWISRPGRDTNRQRSDHGAGKKGALPQQSRNLSAIGRAIDAGEICGNATACMLSMRAAIQITELETVLARCADVVHDLTLAAGVCPGEPHRQLHPAESMSSEQLPARR
jgi:hypothetical protein